MSIVNNPGNIVSQAFDGACQISPLNKKLYEQLSGMDNLGCHVLDESHPDIDLVYESMDCKVGPYPYLVDDKNMQQFNEFIEHFQKLALKVLLNFFEHDSSAFQRYMNLPEMTYQLLKARGINLQETLIRYDFAFNRDMLKLLEVNIGSKIGGWQVDLTNKYVMNNLHQLEGQGFKQTKAEHITKNLYRALLCAIEQLEKPVKSRNILLIHDEGMNQRWKDYLRLIYQQAKLKDCPEGDLIFSDTVDGLTISQEGEVSFKECQVDVVQLSIEERDQIPLEVMFKLIDAQMKNKLVFPDSPLCMVLGSKVLLALFHESKTAGFLEKKELEFVKKFIPFSAPLSNNSVLWQGETWSIAELLSRNKDNLVIKKSISFQGRDVFIGRFTDTQSWQQVCAEKTEEGGWIVQEYCNNGSLLGVSPEHGLEYFKHVWAIFECGNRFSGMFVRGSAELIDGVINSAKGANVYLAFSKHQRNTLVI